MNNPINCEEETNLTKKNVNLSESAKIYTDNNGHSHLNCKDIDFKRISTLEHGSDLLKSQGLRDQFSDIVQRESKSHQEPKRQVFRIDSQEGLNGGPRGQRYRGPIGFIK